ncbi:MAG: nucleoside:proton symporter [Alphaproteobacteria bacterium]|nr:nucleoside:proton symporter [Alphaproteobacteria bacterium]
MLALQSAFGVVVLLAFAWAISEQRFAVSARNVLIGLAVTFVLAILCLKLQPIRDLFTLANVPVQAIADATRAGTSFVFGYLGGAELPFEPKRPGTEFIFAFQVLPIVLVMSVLTTLLFYWKIIPPIVRGFSWLLERTMRVGGAVGLATAANIFVGMVEAPLFIRPYLARLSRSELFVVMTGGMASIAGSVLVLYATLLAPVIPDAAGQLIIASVLSAPAAILISQIMVPESEERHTDASLIEPEPVAVSTMDAVVKGTTVGLQLLLNIVAMLIVLVALVHLVNAALGVLPQLGGEPITLQRMLGYAMAPVCWLMGLPWQEAVTGGELMGIKTILNELIAYVRLAELPQDALSERSRLIMLYALCGFANFGSLGILMAGLTTMVPERQKEIVALGPRSIVSGTLATCLTGAVVGVLTWT